MPNLQDSEDALELATVELFKSLGYDHANLYHETFGYAGSHGRLASSVVVFRGRLRESLGKLNDDVPEEALSTWTPSSEVRLREEFDNPKLVEDEFPSNDKEA